MNLGNDDDSSTLKKPRVVWSLDLHLQFIQAINQLGIDKAVPKEILELMNVPGLTRENVASHLSEYRFYLKRLSGVLLQPNSLSSGYMQENLQGNPHNNPLLMHMAQSQSHSLAQMLNEISISQESALPSPIGQLGLTNGISVGVLTRSGSPENGRGSGQTSFNSGS